MFLRRMQYLLLDVDYIYSARLGEGGLLVNNFVVCRYNMMNYRYKSNWLPLKCFAWWLG